MIAAYPLTWPDGWPRTPPDDRKFGRFTKGERVYSSALTSPSFYLRKKELSVTDGLARCLMELQRMQIDRQDVVISSNVRTRLDGLPRAGGKKPDDPGVACYWQDGNHRRVMAIDIYREVPDNLAAIAATLHAMRAIERHGGAQILERAFTGFAALPAPGASKSWRDVLGFHPATTQSAASINDAYRRLAAVRHPDKGGSADAMSELNRAHDEALQEVER